MAVLSLSEARANLFRPITQALIIGGPLSATAALAHRSGVFFGSGAYRFMGAGQKWPAPLAWKAPADAHPTGNGGAL